MTSRLAVALFLLLMASPSLAGSPLADTSSERLEAVTVQESHDPSGERGLQLTFPRLAARPDPARFSTTEALAFVAQLEAFFLEEQPTARVASVGFALLPPSRNSLLEERIRASYLKLYGDPSRPLPDSLEHSRWFQALRLSPRFMPEGVREAGLALFTSPTTAYSLALSILLYMTAWAAPEPLFSKAFATAITVSLLLTYSAAELRTVGLACWALYQEAEAAQTQEQVEAAAKRFGQTMGGVGLRVLITVAGARMARNLPDIPKGGVWPRLSPPRLALPGGGGIGSSGFVLGLGARAQVNVADGTVMLMGVSAGTAAAAVSAAVASARTTGDCREASDKGEARRHHIATDKNDLSEASGGPWTPLFRELFTRAGMDLDDPANIVYLIGHVGPHPKDYHQAIADRLETALGSCQTLIDCRSRLTSELNRIAADICKRGSAFNSQLTRRP